MSTKLFFSVLAVLLLALCLVVPAVNAISYTLEGIGGNYTIGELQPSEQITINQAPYTVGISLSGAQGTFSDSVTTYASNNEGSHSFKVYSAFSTQQGIRIVDSTIIYTVISSTPEPTPTPINPYISVTEVRQDSLGTIYRFQCLPSGDRVFYSKIMPFEIPAFQAPSYSPDLTSEQTVIEYRVPAGGTSVFSAVYVTDRTAQASVRAP